MFSRACGMPRKTLQASANQPLTPRPQHLAPATARPAARVVHGSLAS
jgi:hypothetical protein